MNDTELDRLVAAAAPVSDAHLAALDLRDADVELIENVMSASAGGVGPTPESPLATPRRQRRRRRGLVAAAAMAAITAAAIAVAAVHPATGGRHDDVATRGENDLPRLVADPPPRGYPVVTLDKHGAGSSFWPSALVAASGTTVLYGDVVAEDPTHDLVVTAAAGADTHELYRDRTGPRSVTVRGHRAQACADGLCGNVPGNKTVSWDERAGLTIILQSRSLDLDRLVAIADGLEVDGDQVELGSLPPGVTGLDEVGRTHQWPTPAGGPAGYRLTYGTEPRPAGTAAARELVSLTVTPGDAAALALRAWQSGFGHPGKVRGHHGWSLIMDRPSQGIRLRLVWLEAPGVLVDATFETTALEAGFDLSRFADSLRPATDEEWDTPADIPAGHAKPDVPATDSDVPDTEVASHVPKDAQAVATTDRLGGATYLAADGRICGLMVDQQGKLPDTCGSTTQRIHELRDRSGDVRFLFGTMPAGAVAIEARRGGVANGAPAFQDVADGGARIWIFPTDIFVPETIAFVDGKNNPVETVPYTP
ncbi:MAG TPA: hypothetical protein VKB57_16050 [Acidimicrobiales bacterium]|nr:hypothetical protein [Acidimicrobiales bacterium]